MVDPTMPKDRPEASTVAANRAFFAALDPVDESADCSGRSGGIPMLINRLQRIARQRNYMHFLQGYCSRDLEAINVALDVAVRDINELVVKANRETGEIRATRFSRLQVVDNRAGHIGGHLVQQPRNAMGVTRSNLRMVPSP